jgi:hypothetical protein
VSGQSEPGKPAPGDDVGFAPLGVENLQPQHDVVDRGAPRHQPVVLEHDADLAAKEVELAERVVTGHLDPAAGRLDQAGEQVEHGRLAAAGLAQHRDDLALLDLERKAIDRREGPRPVGPGELLGHVAEADERIGHRDQAARSATGR